MYKLDIVQRKGKEMILLEIDTYTEEDMEEYGEFLFGEESYPDVGEIHGLTMVFDEQGAKRILHAMKSY